MPEVSLISIAAAQALYRDEAGAHGFEHVLRVLQLAERIGRLEGAEMCVIQAAALLHDVGRGQPDPAGEGHAVIGARLARQALAHQPAMLVEQVAHAVLAHRFRGDVQPATLEAQIVSDADKLDAIGAIGIARAYAVAGELGQQLWSGALAEDRDAAGYTPVDEYVHKLSRLGDRLYTSTARGIAACRQTFMAGFFEQLDREVKGEA